MVLLEIHQRFKGHFLNELGVSFKNYHVSPTAITEEVPVKILESLREKKGDHLSEGIPGATTGGVL